MWRLGDHCGTRLAKLAMHDQRIWALDGDLADSDGCIHFARRHPERFIMAGIAEQSMVSVAAGMASCGLRPWVFSFAAFLCYRAYDQIRVCLSQARQPVTLVGSHSGGCAGRNGKTHAAFNDIALLATLPHLRIWAPADTKDLHLAMDDVLHHQEPAYLRLPRCEPQELPGCAAPLRSLAETAPITIVTSGFGAQLARRVQCQLISMGVEVGLLHCPRLAPLPVRQLHRLLKTAQTIFTIEDHYTLGGLGSLLQQLSLSARVVPLGWPAGFSGACGSDQELLRLGGLAAEDLANQIAKG